MRYSEKDYGQEGYAERDSTGGEEAVEIDLMRYLPQYWQESGEMQALQQTAGREAGRLYEELSDLEKQMFLETATWGLERWERVFGLEVDPVKSDLFRRERIRAKLRGAGTTTKQMIVNVASAFANGEAEVIEEPENSRFVVKFIGTKGVPANLQDLAATIEEIKPAHLAFTFAYTYNYWNTLKGRSWASVKNGTWEQMRVI